MTDCAKCGACTAVCPVYRVTGREFLTARGKLHLLERLSTRDCSASYADILSQCLLCGACEASCPRGLDITRQIAKARHDLPLLVGDHPFFARLLKQALATPALMTGLASLRTACERLLPPHSGLRTRLGLPPTPHLRPDAGTAPLPVQTPPQSAVAYFSGCFARYLEPEISRATEKLLLRSGSTAPHQPTAQTCCGQAAYSSGDRAEAIRLAKRNITAFADHAQPILTSCASCYSHLASYPALLRDEPEWSERARAFADRLREFSSFFADSASLAMQLAPPSEPPSQQSVFYHDPCHLRFGHRIVTPPRRLLASAGFHLHAPLHGPQCCGMGGLFHLAHPELADKIRTRLLDDLGSPLPDLVTTTCTGCLLHLRSGRYRQGETPPVPHLAVLLAGQLKT